MFLQVMKVIAPSVTPPSKQTSFRSETLTRGLIFLTISIAILLIIYILSSILCKRNRVKDIEKTNLKKIPKCEFCQGTTFVKNNDKFICQNCFAEYNKKDLLLTNDAIPKQKTQCKFCNGETFSRQNKYLVCNNCGFKYKIKFGKNIKEIIDNQSSSNKTVITKIIRIVVAITLILVLITNIIKINTYNKILEELQQQEETKEKPSITKIEGDNILYFYVYCKDDYDLVEITVYIYNEYSPHLEIYRETVQGKNLTKGNGYMIKFEAPIIYELNSNNYKYEITKYE